MVLSKSMIPIVLPVSNLKLNIELLYYLYISNKNLYKKNYIFLRFLIASYIYNYIFTKVMNSLDFCLIIFVQF